MTDNRYRAFWRWHFYAGVLVLPFMAWLAITGCLSLLALAISSPVMWWKRRNQGKLRTPPRPTSASVATTATATVIFLGLLYPLTGLSALLIWLFDRTLLWRLQRK